MDVLERTLAFVTKPPDEITTQIERLRGDIVRLENALAGESLSDEQTKTVVQSLKEARLEIQASTVFLK
jgi:hypothetical protein